MVPRDTPLQRLYSLRVALLLTVGVVALSLSAGVAAAGSPAPATQNGTAPLDSGSVYSTGQSLQFEAAGEAGAEYTLYRVESSGGSTDLAFVTELILDSAGRATIDTGTGPVDGGTYVLRNEAGAPVAVENGTVTGPASRANATFEVTGDGSDPDDGSQTRPEADKTLDSGETYFTETVLSFEAAADANADYALYRVGDSGPEFVTEVTLDDSGIGLIDTGVEFLGEGTYFLENDERAPVAVDDGVVTGPTRQANATFEVDPVLGAPDVVSGATDTDGDSLREDVDGDGQTGLFDALTYYNNRDSDAITSNPALFDFDGDGVAGTLFDALALYNEIQ